MQKQLHFQADRIEAVLTSHKLQARVAGGTVTPRLVFYKLSLAMGVTLNQIGSLSDELAACLGAPSCRVYRRQGEVVIEVPRGSPQVVSLMELGRRLVQEGSQGPDTVPPAAAILGLDDEGVPLLLRLSSGKVRHCLIAGEAGAGKTSLLRTMAAGLTLFNLRDQRSLQLALAGEELAGLDGSPLLIGPVAQTAQKRLALLQMLVRVMRGRLDEGFDGPRIVLALDEPREEEMFLLAKLVAGGFEASIHLLISSCKSESEMDALRPQLFPVFVQGRAPAGRGLVDGADRLLGAGDFLVRANGASDHLTAAYIDDDELANLMATIEERRARPVISPSPPTRQTVRRVLSFGRL